MVYPGENFIDVYLFLFCFCDKIPCISELSKGFDLAIGSRAIQDCHENDLERSVIHGS